MNNEAIEMIGKLQNSEDIRCKEFVNEHAAHFAMMSPENADFVKKVATRCFRVGFKMGIIGVLDFMEEQNKEKVAKN